MRITSCTPCWGRPERTKRAIECVLDQNINNWEAFFVGDGCECLKNLIDSGTSKQYIEKAESGGNKLHIYNLENHYGGFGYAVRNHIISKASGKYFLFIDNDDVVASNHFENYLLGIEGTSHGFAYCNTYIEPYNQIRNAQLEFGKIGHSEIIVSTDLIKTMPSQNPVYGHDWELIVGLTFSGHTFTKIESEPTYTIKCIGNHRTDTID
jgi:glycosyltransferase involved in cell wall biosynthesis